MRLQRTHSLLPLTVFVLLLTTLVHADFQSGLDANKRGDYKTAFFEWLPLAEQGLVEAQYNLGVLYYNGQGVPQDFAKAREWYLKAAAQGNAGAQYMTGRMYSKGGVAQDYQEALKWYRLAAAQGNAASQAALGNLYYQGRGVPQNYAEAAKWFRLAAEQGDFNGQRGLGLMYEKGHGVPEDYVQAHVWYNLAAANKINNYSDMMVRSSRKRVGEKMTHEQIDEAQRLASEWLAHHQKK